MPQANRHSDCGVSGQESEGVLMCGMHATHCIDAYNGLVLVSIVENLVFENKITNKCFAKLISPI